jgi:hypothetical protein
VGIAPNRRGLACRDQPSARANASQPAHRCQEPTDHCFRGKGITLLAVPGVIAASYCARPGRASARIKAIARSPTRPNIEIVPDGAPGAPPSCVEKRFSRARCP